jgi:hypothetical protein
MMKKTIGLTTFSTFAFFCAGSFLVASEPAAEWTFQGEGPLRDIRGGIEAMQSDANPEGTVSIAAGEVQFLPRMEDGVSRGGTLEVPWDPLVAHFNKGFSIAFVLTYTSLERGEMGKDMGIIDTMRRIPGPFRFGVNQGPNGEKYYVRITTDPTGDPTITMTTDRQQTVVGRPVEVLISFEEKEDGKCAVKLFLDGELVKSEEGETYPLFDATDLVIGSYVERGLTQNFFEGSIANLRIYNSPSPAAE